MTDYILVRKSRNALSSLVHVILNLLLAVISIGATVITGNCIIGLVLIVISKWPGRKVEPAAKASSTKLIPTMKSTRLERMLSHQ